MEDTIFLTKLLYNEILYMSTLCCFKALRFKVMKEKEYFNNSTKYLILLKNYREFP